MKIPNGWIRESFRRIILCNVSQFFLFGFVPWNQIDQFHVVWNSQFYQSNIRLTFTIWSQETEDLFSQIYLLKRDKHYRYLKFQHKHDDERKFQKRRYLVENGKIVNKYKFCVMDALSRMQEKHEISSLKMPECLKVGIDYVESDSWRRRKWGDWLCALILFGGWILEHTRHILCLSQNNFRSGNRDSRDFLLMGPPLTSRRPRRRNCHNESQS